eukprot:XP_765412.1 hypothetical protein [Theileria parva strain Muguga]
MSIINNLRSFDYKYCNLAVLSVFALFQSSKCFFDRNSGDIIGSYITQKKFLSLKEFKDKPYLLKKKLLGFTSNPFKESQTSEWIHTKTSKTTFQSNISIL